MGNKGHKGARSKNNKREARVDALMAGTGKDHENIGAQSTQSTNSDPRKDVDVCEEVIALMKQKKMRVFLNEGYVQSNEVLEQIRVCQEMTEINNAKYGNSLWHLGEDSSYSKYEPSAESMTDSREATDTTEKK